MTTTYPHGNTFCAGCHSCQPDRFPNLTASGPGGAVVKFTGLVDRPPLNSVGLICFCGKPVASIESVARACECGRIWLVSAMQLGGPL